MPKPALSRCFAAVALALALPAAAEVTGTGRWAPGIGDATVLGWVTVFVYAGLAVHAARQARAAAASRRERLALGVLAALLALLAINKQLDLQTWFTQFGRDLAVEQGWYARRRPVQVAFVAGLAVAALLALAALRQLLVGQWRRLRLLAPGVTALVLFVLVRAATIHHIDGFLSLHLGGVKLNNLLELAALALLAHGLAAWRRAYDADQGGPPRPAAAHPGQARQAG